MLIFLSYFIFKEPEAEEKVPELSTLDQPAGNYENGHQVYQYQ